MSDVDESMSQATEDASVVSIEDGAQSEGEGEGEISMDELEERPMAIPHNENCVIPDCTCDNESCYIFSSHDKEPGRHNRWSNQFKKQWPEHEMNSVARKKEALFICCCHFPKSQFYGTGALKKLGMPVFPYKMHHLASYHETIRKGCLYTECYNERAKMKKNVHRYLTTDNARTKYSSWDPRPTTTTKGQTPAARQIHGSYFPAESIFRDKYRCMHVNAEKFPNPISKDFLLDKMSLAIAPWKSRGIKAIWFKLNLKDHADYFPVLSTLEFQFHHAKENSATMIKWISSEPANIPPYPYTNVGVGGLVVDRSGRILVVKEKHSLAYDSGKNPFWKLPGGYCNKGEDIGHTAEREVFEETGVTSRFESVLCFRHLHTFQFDGSDIYFVCVMRVDDSRAENVTLKADPQEIMDVKWMSARMARVHMSEFNKRILDLYDEVKDVDYKIRPEEVNFILGGKTKVYLPTLDPIDVFEDDIVQ